MFLEDWSVKTALEITTSLPLDPKSLSSQLQYYIYIVGQNNQSDFVQENKSKFSIANSIFR